MREWVWKRERTRMGKKIKDSTVCAYVCICVHVHGVGWAFQSSREADPNVSTPLSSILQGSLSNGSQSQILQPVPSSSVYRIFCVSSHTRHHDSVQTSTGFPTLHMLYHQFYFYFCLFLRLQLKNTNIHDTDSIFLKQQHLMDAFH